MKTIAARKPTFCCRLHYLSINGNLGRGERLDDSFFVSNDRATIEALLPKYFEASIGRMEYRHFKESPVVAYARLDGLPRGSEQTRLLEHLLLLDAFENVYVHGAPLKAADELKLEAMSQKLDILARQCFHTILEDEALFKAILSDADIDELMLSRLFA
jgi:hypothetical protein